MADLPTEEDLRQLPLRSIVAYAARCARRVQPLFQSEKLEHVETVNRAIQVADAFAAGLGSPAGGDYAAFHLALGAALEAAEGDDAALAAADALDAALKAAERNDAAHASGATHAARQAALNAVHAVHAARDALHAPRDVARAAARADFQTLLALSRERRQQFPELGDPVDVSESGPLGPLWPDGPPEGWPQDAPPASPPHTRRKKRQSVPKPIRSRKPPEPCGDAELVVEIEVPTDVTDEELIRAVGELADRADGWHRALGGDGLKIERLEIGTEARVPEGAPHG